LSFQLSVSIEYCLIGLIGHLLSISYLLYLRSSDSNDYPPASAKMYWKLVLNWPAG